MRKFLLLFTNLLIVFPAISQPTKPTLEEISRKINKELPLDYDHATKLVATTVQNTNFYYHFTIKANLEEYKLAFPKVKAQILKTICSQPREFSILKNYKADIVYKYENEKGSTLGEFMVKPEHCLKK